ncbi:type II toxin-antitoxin system HipA family toxin [Mucilaginibacter endophyticus]|uniref:type II toxin-antitoxin system HipA family toxin n=1 Tax=Mucilaginibacter endophyticus TaxID=2675003 RepID=UPI000E0E0265|nr:HipA domain-containing protein [Mucilaginibacter endophyticus]
MARRILVYADWDGLPEIAEFGTLTADISRGNEIFSFEYSPSWLQSPQAQLLDPDLQLYAGPQYLNDDKPNFGMFLDSSPDRWGRMLMKRREAITARQEERKPVSLNESDFLLGVFDGTRMGGLRFKTTADGEFLSHVAELAAPPWIALRDLEYASLRLETEDMSATEELRWLNMLIAPGSSLGGARPKASVTDPEGNLWMAKFPSANDEYDMGAWEMVVLELALIAGIKVSPAQLQQFSGKHRTFLTSRFDRVGGNRRVHFASAMTLLGQQDGADFHSGSSYLDMVEFIIRNGSNVKENLKELWKRVVFNILVKNTDDHLRNHGFLLRDNGWELSPAYDMNANPQGRGLTLNISENDNSLDPELALSVAVHFRLKLEDAKVMLEQIKNAVAQWPKIATKYKLPRREQENMDSAFSIS